MQKFLRIFAIVLVFLAMLFFIGCPNPTGPGTDDTQDTTDDTADDTTDDTSDDTTDDTTDDTSDDTTDDTTDEPTTYVDGSKTLAFQTDDWIIGNIMENAYPLGDTEVPLNADQVTGSWQGEGGGADDDDGVLAVAITWPTEPTADIDYKLELGSPGFADASLHDLSGDGSKVSTRIYIPEDYKNDGSLTLRLYLKDGSYNSLYSETLQVWRLPAGGWYTLEWVIGTAEDAISVTDGSGVAVDTTDWFSDAWNENYEQEGFDASSIKIVGIAFSAKNFNDGNENTAVIDDTDKLLIDWLDTGYAGVY